MDKVDVRVPRLARFTRQFEELYGEIATKDVQPTTERKNKRLRSSRYYQSNLDLREFGYSTILHSFARLSKDGDHKIEFIETGSMSYSHMHHEIESIFDIDPEKLAVMRADLATDVPDIPVLWFVDHYRAQYKRWAADIGKVVDENEYSAMGMRVVQTFYLGKRPNVIRFYDKVAEFKHQYVQLLRKLEPGAQIPTFEETYGVPPDAVLTRVERQLGGGRIPQQIDTFGKLRCADSFNPFQRLRMIDGSDQCPRPGDCRSDVYERGIEVGESILQQGFHRTRYLLNEQSRGNADRILKTVLPFIPNGGYRITPDELFARYQESVSRQLRA
jgi:hypothetical protein